MKFTARVAPVSSLGGNMQRLICAVFCLALVGPLSANDDDDLAIDEDTTESAPAAPAEAAGGDIGAEPPEAPDMGDLGKGMESMVDMVGPMMGKMMQAMITAQLDVLSQPDTATKMATYVKNLHDALIAKGFNADQAMRIVTSLPLPSASPAAK
jgi:hypothetical protein